MEKEKTEDIQTATNSRYYFSGNCERKVVGTTTTQYIWIGGDAYTAVAVAKKVGTGAWTVYNIFRDHLGTITHLKNGSNAADDYSFDAWGRRRNATNWSYTLDANDKALFAERGFTGHEYLEDFKLYNMNGRLYDPVVGRLLSADPVVQDPSFTQSYNRYSYCLNNPLKFTDPSGESWKSFWDQVGDSFSKLGNWMNENNIHINFNTSYDPVTNRFSSQQMYIQMPSWDVGYTLKEVRSYAGGFDDKVYKGSIWKRVPQSTGGTWSTAIDLTLDWALGTGEDNRTFSNDAIANSFRDARVINQARDYWYNQVNTGKKTINDGVTNFLGRKAWTGGNFGVKGLIAAGLDPMEQFVGSLTPMISSNGSNLTFTIQNTTSFRSLMYGIAPDWLRSTWRPGGNMSQTYTFTEPINFNRIR